MSEGEEFFEANCGLTEEGSCVEAGTEYCEFECPFNPRWRQGSGMNAGETPVDSPIQESRKFARPNKRKEKE